MFLLFEIKCIIINGFCTYVDIQYAQCKLLKQTWTSAKCVCMRVSVRACARACMCETFCQDVGNEVSLLKMNKYVFIYQLSF